MQLTTNRPESARPSPPARPAPVRFFLWLVAQPWAGLVVGLLTLGLYLLVSYGLNRALPPAWNLYLAQPVLWGSLALLGIVVWHRRTEDTTRTDWPLVALAGLIGLFQVAMLALAGLLVGFGYSPYTRGLLPMLGNGLYLLTLLAGIEASRAAVLAVLGRQRPFAAMALTALLYALFDTSIHSLTRIGGMEAFFRLAGQRILPSLSENLLASLLALLAGPVASFTYRAVLTAFEWLSPALPRLHWIGAAFVGTLSPVIGFAVVRGAVMRRMANQDVDSRERISTLWLLVALIAVSLFFFNSGLLGVRPSLVTGVSMNPTLAVGDVVITRDVPPEAVEVGDIVRYQLNQSYVLHRVIAIQEDGGTRTFITRGDNNNVADAPVSEEQLGGKMILTVPKIGWVGVLVRKVLGGAG